MCTEVRTHLYGSADTRNAGKLWFVMLHEDGASGAPIAGSGGRVAAGEVISSKRGWLTLLPTNGGLRARHCLRYRPVHDLSEETRVRQGHVDLIVRRRAGETARIRSATAWPLPDCQHRRGY